MDTRYHCCKKYHILDLVGILPLFDAAKINPSGKPMTSLDLPPMSDPEEGQDTSLPRTALSISAEDMLRFLDISPDALVLVNQAGRYPGIGAYLAEMDSAVLG